MTSFPPQQGPPPAGPARPRSPITLRLGIIFLVVAALLLITTILLGYLTISRVVADQERLLFPGTHIIELERTGSYRIFHEYQSILDGRTIRQSTPPAGLNLSVTGPDGQTIPLRPHASETYQYGARHGSSLFAFDIERPGSYTLSGEVSGQDEEFVLTVGRGVFGLVAGIFGAICGGFLVIALGIIGLVLTIVGLVQRGRAQRAVQSA